MNGLYQISNFGEVKSYDKEIRCTHNATRIKKGRVLKGIKLRDGYLYVHLYKQKTSKYKTIHRLVAETFILNLEGKREVNHIDGNKENNIFSNLEWTTPKENIQHAWENGLAKKHSTKKKIEVIK